MFKLRDNVGVEDFGFKAENLNTPKFISLKDMNKNLYNAKGNKKMQDAGFNALTAALSLLETKIVKPKNQIYYQFDVPLEMGGGFQSVITQFKVDYSGLNELAVAGTRSNAIPKVNAGLSQMNYELYLFQMAYDLSLVELEMAGNLEKFIPESITSIYSDIITLGFDYFVQNVAYYGMGNSKGLFNHDKVKTTVLAKDPKTMTNEELYGMFNGIFAYYIEASNGIFDLLPNHFLIPTDLYKELTSRISDIAFGKNLLQAITENNYGTSIPELQGELKVTITARPGLATEGTYKHGRIVAYRKTEENVKLRITQPLKPILSMPDVQGANQTTIFAGQVSQLMLPYNEDDATLGAVTYWDWN